jgi:hypothetical protein
MGLFSQKLSEIAGESRFSKLELESVFSSEEDQKTLIDVKEALANASDDNEAISKIQDMGKKGIEVLVKLGKKILIS